MGAQLDRSKQATCLIVSANQVVVPYPVYPIGASYLVGALTSKGHLADHFDILADGGLQRLELLLAKTTYDLIGVSIRNLDSVDSSCPSNYLEDVINTIKCIRKMSTAHVVLGGPAFSILPEDLLELMKADYGIVGEGEILLPWLASCIAKKEPPEERILYSEPCKNVWRGAGLTSNTANYYLKHGGMLNVQTKRGCPYSCTYCSYPNLEGKTIRYRDSEEVVEEFKRLETDYGAKYIFFTDSVFNDPKGQFIEVAEALIRRKNTLPWCAFFRPQNLQKELLQTLKRAGMAAIELGSDGASDTTLAGLGKGFSFSDVLDVHNEIVRAEIPVAHFIMFGGPGEDELTLNEGLRNIEKLDNSVVFAYSGIRILPDTEIYKIGVAENIISHNQSLVEPVFYFSPKIEQKVIDEQLKKAFAKRMDRIYPCHDFEGRIKMLHELGHVGPLWDLILKRGKRNG